jgi:drug/metabolite transporter (DMT)-like permease
MSSNAAIEGGRTGTRAPVGAKLNQSTIDHRSRRNLVPVIGLGIAIALWGANWPVMKAGLSHVTPLWFSALRFGTGAACLFAVQAARRGIPFPRREDIPFVASIGILQMLLFTALGALAMTHLAAGRSAILSYTTPLWVAPASVMFFKERISPLRVGGIMVAAFGVLILMNPIALDWHSAWVLGGNAMLLLASLCWAICILHLRYFKSASSALILAPWQMLLATALLIPLALLVEGPFTGDGTAEFYEIILFVGPVATAFCFVAVNAASTWLPATTMSTAMLGVPVTGVVLSIVFLGEPMNAPLLVGSFAIVAGIAINAMAAKPKSARV